MSVIKNDTAARAFSVDPTNNVVLEASAGTGKTSVLVERYLNLLKASVSPMNILAMTFTRKAAAEMRERIVQNLRAAVARGEIDEDYWKNLRDRINDIEIMTIDAFCLSLLREFPLEADLDPGFTIADETEIPGLLDEALDRTLRTAYGLVNSDSDVALVLGVLTPTRLRTGLGHLIGRRLIASDVFDRHLVSGSRDMTAERACRNAADRFRDLVATVPGGLDQFLADGPVGHPRFEMFVRDVRSLVVEREQNPIIIRATLDRIAKHFLTRAKKPRVRITDYGKHHCVSETAWRRHSSAVAGLAPSVAGMLDSFAVDINYVLVRGMRRLLSISLNEYRGILTSKALLDFPEVLDRTLGLLRQMDEFAQSRYRLESRYHHILVDEFQDTSRAQWELISLLVRSWGEGFGLVHEARIPPSIFLVGDRKQSIYRFRDTEVELLREAVDHVDMLRAGSTSRRWISHSFRSVQKLLEFTNDLFQEVEKDPGKHGSFSYDDDDRFPLEAVSELERSSEENATNQNNEALGVIVGDQLGICAEAVAEEISRLLIKESIRDKQSGVFRRVISSDIAILFRSRDSHREFQLALENHRISSYAYKGLGFFDAEEIKDLCAIVSYLGDPGSDLKAAAFLRSRLVRLSDEGLKRLSPRISQVLLGGEFSDSCGQLSNEDQRVFSRLKASLKGWLSLIDLVPPSDLLDLVLSETAYEYELNVSGSSQARENVKKFSALIRRIQNRGFSTMSKIAEHVDRLSSGDESNAVVDANDAVSLMTVHASKGLEFPIVFLVNLSRGARGTPQPVRLVTESGGGSNAVSVASLLPAANSDERARDREELKRLLYVAVTRARDRLYFSTVLADGEMRPGLGSLGEVLPRSFHRMLESVSRASGECVFWSQAGLKSHAFRICRGLTTSYQDEAVVNGCVTTETQSQENTVATSVSGEQAIMPRVSKPGEFTEPRRIKLREPMSQVDRLACLLTHRLLRSEPKKVMSIGEVKAYAAGLVRAHEVSGFEVPEEAVQRATLAYMKLCRNPAFLLLLRGGQCFYDVPFSLQVQESKGGELVRGSIDCLVRSSDGRVTLLDVSSAATTTSGSRLDRDLKVTKMLFPNDPVSILTISV